MMHNIVEVLCVSCVLIYLYWRPGCRKQLIANLNSVVSLCSHARRMHVGSIHWFQFGMTVMILRSGCSTLGCVTHQLVLWVTKIQTPGFILIYFISWPAINAVTESRPRPHIHSLQHTHSSGHVLAAWASEIFLYYEDIKHILDDLKNLFWPLQPELWL